MGIMRKVIGTVDEKTFYKFKDRVESEGLSLGECFSAMISLYAHGGEIVALQSTKDNMKKDVDVYREYKNGGK